MTDRHPDDEALSALLDHEDTSSDAAAHIAGCADCQRRMDRLDQVARAVAGSPPPPSPAVVERAVAAALAAAREGASSQQAPVAERRRRLVALAAVAAVAVAGLALVPLLSHRRASTAASGAGARTQEGAADASKALAIQDLGDQDNAQQLRDLVQGRLGTNGAAAQAPAAAAGSAPSGSSVATAPPGAAPLCLDQAREVAGASAPLLYQATLRWRGQPSQLVVFAASPSSGGSLSHQLLVLDRATCAVLVSQRF